MVFCQWCYYLQNNRFERRMGFNDFIIIRLVVLFVPKDNHGFSKDLKQAAYHSITSGNDMAICRSEAVSNST